MSKKSKLGTRFPLLVYRHIFKMWFWPSTFLFAASVVLVALQPPLMGGWSWVFIPAALVAAGLMVYALLARYATYAQAHRKTLRVRSPFFKLVVSYGRINTVRTTPFKAQFPPERLSWSHRRLAEKLYGRTCLMIDLTGYPMSRRWLSVWFHRLLLPDQSMGLALVVEEWLQLSSEVESARAEWVSRRLIQREERTVEQVLRS